MCTSCTNHHMRWLVGQTSVLPRLTLDDRGILTPKNGLGPNVSVEGDNTPELLGKTVASQGYTHRNRQSCLTQTFRRIVMAMVEQMIRRPGNAKPAIADNDH